MKLEKPCKVWTGCIVDGYGHKNVRDASSATGWRTVRVHRYEWEQANGPLPTDMCVCHHCDNRACYELEHLFAGSRTENMHDMWAKGRAVTLPGERHGARKLSEADVLAIRADHAAGVKTKALAERYGIHRNQRTERRGPEELDVRMSEVEELRTLLASVTAERDTLHTAQHSERRTFNHKLDVASKALTDSRAELAETKAALVSEQGSHDRTSTMLHKRLQQSGETISSLAGELEASRAETAAATARVAELDSAIKTMSETTGAALRDLRERVGKAIRSCDADGFVAASDLEALRG